ncbi:late embryogenesis abundant protein D-34-like protein [Tanacetum coccineum]
METNDVAQTKIPDKISTTDINFALHIARRVRLFMVITDEYVLKKQSGKKRKRSFKSHKEDNLQEAAGSQSEGDESQEEDDKNTSSKPVSDEEINESDEDGKMDHNNEFDCEDLSGLADCMIDTKANITDEEWWLYFGDCMFHLSILSSDVCFYAIRPDKALEATTRTAGSKAMDQSGAAAIQVTEVRATGSTLFITGEVAAQAQSAATLNTSTRDEDKVTLSVVVTEFAARMRMAKAFALAYLAALSKSSRLSMTSIVWG